ncbi:hypothetical protein [Cytophaga hutchinsonii]|uniref:Uncharacterized protein n=1 Tax=Cytophaga hutchinsonii (strain ATCC 33406 / DSM 1761 / CIP 103989 / NBRC 15051 / NCIMB 9469 / D465) TaxID=269798 RepID=A0A6N4SQ40_CYTH3|nr:hypothetical protein [Cytophaga hutchinsonii]ABG58401.1 hypothetical protein CHU_1126 [Cytophaga hutchinsonii ATCC 33406]
MRNNKDIALLPVLLNCKSVPLHGGTLLFLILGEVEEFHSNDIKTSFKGLLLLESSDEDGNTYRTKILVE